MALTRSMLKGMNLTEEQVGAIIDAHKETVDALKEQRDSFKAEADKLPGLQKELDGFRNGKDWKGEYDRLTKEFSDYKAEVAGKETLAMKQNAYRKLLKAENIPDKFHDRIIKMTEFDKMEMDGDAIKDENGARAGIKTEWGEYVATGNSQADKPDAPPHGDNHMTKQEILAIKDTTERQKMIAANLDLFKR